MKYSDLLMEWLADAGYTHCFGVAGGNIMHLLESASRKLTFVPFVHEVAAGIAAEYFNEVSDDKKALALVTAGPGITNIVSALAGAYLESRELLVIGGQVKTADLARGKLRQRGIQEIDGLAIARPICVASTLMEAPMERAEFDQLCSAGRTARKGPVFIEIPLDVQARDVENRAKGDPARVAADLRPPTDSEISAIVADLSSASRPILLLGGGIDRKTSTAIKDELARFGVPVMLTWNAADRLAEDHPMFFGRPNTWGQRYANLLLQQSDLIVALGTRLGMQQTGFNWQEFGKNAKVIHVDCDEAELEKGQPRVDRALCCDANRLLRAIASAPPANVAQWVQYCREVRKALPLNDPANVTSDGCISPYEFVLALSELCSSDDVVIPCSSGGAFTTMMQAFKIRDGQTMVTNKGLASMGYGLSGAIGAALARPDRRTVLVEGDGGFAVNLQEIGTARAQGCNLKIFLFVNNGYGSIRMTQRSYFGGRYVGCDHETGLGLPDWETLFRAYDVPVARIGPNFAQDHHALELFNGSGCAAFLVAIDPEQTYFPKITSRVTASGGMESNPLQFMSPPLDDELLSRVGRYLEKSGPK
jgi:acetolactate synthase-1/2/3 large subunit